ncbi:conserved hypothetical protein [Candidatus Terasakiella magnetica]|uniref:RloB-like protein n=1 Tax=Candidatus Terasakiella magnetica TaxID=1867952 RepID=A0A1C3REW1_9PROT|nr:RloB family protein [Candidatus Terasakiella magnetica]SCA55795.1 conserved hypothetical protein [Candidatus Terasakiella magnetica]
MGRRQGRKSFGRAAASRDVYEKILIVCEDELTSPQYLNAHIRTLGLPRSIQAKATGDSNPTPDQVVAYALKWLDGEKCRDGFGEHKTTVFCVIDRDEHEKFDSAMAELNGAAKQRNHLNKKVHIRAFPSYPCFEVWYLLHHVKTRKGFNRAGENSPADMVIKDLKKIPVFANYDKGDNKHYEVLVPQQATAMANAVWSKNDAIATGELNSSTEVHELMDYLNNLKATMDAEKKASRRKR